jgi:hypothetical protein
MLRLVSEGRELEIGGETSIRMLQKSPLMTLNDITLTRSFPFSISSNRVNDPILKNQNRISPPVRNISNFTNKIPLDIYWDQYCLWRGNLNITNFEKNKYNVNFIETPLLNFDKLLNECVFGASTQYTQFTTKDALLDTFAAIAQSSNLDNPQIPYYVFPVYDEIFKYVDEANPGYPWINQWSINDCAFAGRWSPCDNEQYVIFPRLYNVLTEIFTRNTNIIVDGATTYTTPNPFKVNDNFFSKNPNWYRACLFNTYAIVKDNLNHYNISISNHLPQVKVYDFLLHLSNYLNIRYIFNNRNRTVEFVQMQDVIQCPDIIDFNKNVESYYKKETDIEYDGFLLKQNPDELDENFLAQEEYIQYGQTGSKIQTVDTDFSYLTRVAQDFNPGGSSMWGFVPTCKQNSSDWATNKPRIIFYTGMVSPDNGPSYFYPKGENNYNGDYAYITYYDDTGIYSNFHKNYFRWLLYHKQQYNFRKKMNIEDLLNFDFKLKRRIKDLNVLVDEIDVTLKKDSISTANITCFTV